MCTNLAGVLTKGTVIEVNVSELGLVTTSGKVVWSSRSILALRMSIADILLRVRSDHKQPRERRMYQLVAALVIQECGLADLDVLRDGTTWTNSRMVRGRLAILTVLCISFSEDLGCTTSCIYTTTSDLSLHCHVES